MRLLLMTLLFLTSACAIRPPDVTAANAALDNFVSFPTSPHQDTPASVSALLRFAELDPGGFVLASLDMATGLPVAKVQVESKDRRLPLGLEADGILVAIDTDQRSTGSDPIELEWTPWHGNGRYVLNLQLLDWQNGTVPSSQVITVNVTGIPDHAESMKSRFIGLYQEHFGVNLTTPIFARYNAPNQAATEESRWVSAAYIEDMLYEINIFDDGRITSTSYTINSNEGGGFCRPRGTIRMLAVVVDYGNTGLNPADVEIALQSGLEEAQRHWDDYSRQLGFSVPILELELTTFVYGAPPQAGEYLTPGEILSAGGPDPADFDLLTEIDLDKENSVTGQYGGLGVSLGDGCRPLGARRTNIAFTVRDRNSLQNAMQGAVFEHEFTHSMGWMHWWPNQSGDGMSWVRSSGGWEPSLLFGWTDVDHDGVIEIIDPTPYGLIE